MKVVLAVSLLASPVVGWSSLNMKAGKSERRWDLVWGSLAGNPVFGVHDVLAPNGDPRRAGAARTRCCLGGGGGGREESTGSTASRPPLGERSIGYRRSGFSFP